MGRTDAAPAPRANGGAIRPFLKWAGGKAAQTDRILAAFRRAGADVGRMRLVEPFAGGAALTLAAPSAANLLADANPDLVRVHRTLKHEPERLVELTRDLFREISAPGDGSPAEAYYRLRRRFNAGADDEATAAALFVVLNRHCYNGLCRYNASGEFNVPYGRYAAPYLPEEEMLAAGAFLRDHDVDVRLADFTDVLSVCGEGDAVYCDPPYFPASGTAEFTDYTRGGFGAHLQERLAREASLAAARGATVLISNSDVPAARHLYGLPADGALTVEDHGADTLLAGRSIGARASSRGGAGEILCAFTPDGAAARAA